jgi:hypothetical protein
MIARFITNTLFSTPLFPYWLLWREFCSIWEALEHQANLMRLVTWAKRKKLRGMREYYKRLYFEVELNLLHKKLRHLRLVCWTEWAYIAYRMLFPNPQYYPKGAAANYSLRKRSLI